MDFRKPITVIEHLSDGAVMSMLRPRSKGRPERYRRFRMGPNHIHAFITHPDGTVTDLGTSKNLLTNIGRDVLCGGLGGFKAAGQTNASGILTAVSGTTAQDTGSVWTASNLATPQLGIAGMRIIVTPHVSTNPVVYGNIISNTTHIATIDKWWNLDDTTGTTPTNGDSFSINPGSMTSARFMALTTDSGAASAADTVLASEITTAGCGRALATYAHTFGQATFTLQKAFSVTGTLTAIHKMGLFGALSAAGADPMIFETVLNLDATVGNGDTLTVTDTVTVSG